MEGSRQETIAWWQQVTTTVIKRPSLIHRVSATRSNDEHPTVGNDYAWSARNAGGTAGFEVEARIAFENKTDGVR